jgi:uncharacterized protein YyaL (SSP411 family)
MQDTLKMLKALRSRFLPNKVVVFVPLGEKSPDIHRFAEFTKVLSAIGGSATAHVCANHTCNLPTTDVARMMDFLSL